MTEKSSFVLWSARIVGLGICVFLALFALDAWDPAKTGTERASQVLMHLLPSIVVLALLAVSWRRQWIGGFGFVALAIAYAVMVKFRLDWVAVISGPLLAAGALFFWSSVRGDSRLTQR
jgi:hypothetical protein